MDSKTDGKTSQFFFFSKRGKTEQFARHAKISQTPNSPCKISQTPNSPCKLREPPTSPPPEPLVLHIPPKRAKTSGLGESFRHAQPDPQAPTDSQCPSVIAPEAIIKRPMVTMPPIEGNSNCRARSYHSELYFDIEVMQ